MRFFNQLPSRLRVLIGAFATFGLAGIAVLTIALMFIVENETNQLIFASVGILAAMTILIAWQLMKIHFNRLERLHKAVLVAQSPNAKHVVYGGIEVDRRMKLPGFTRSSTR